MKTRILNNYNNKIMFLCYLHKMNTIVLPMIPRFFIKIYIKVNFMNMMKTIQSIMKIIKKNSMKNIFKTIITQAKPSHVVVIDYLAPQRINQNAIFFENKCLNHNMLIIILFKV